MSESNQKPNLPGYYWLAVITVPLIVVVLIIILIFQTADSPVNQPAVSPISTEINQQDPVFRRIGLAALTIPSASTDCSPVLNYYQENALEQVGPWGLNDQNRLWPHEEIIVDTAAVSAEADAASSSQSQPAKSQTDYSTTNIQVEGVDEADIVKTDGRYIYILAGQKLKIIDVSQASADSSPELVAEVDLGFQAGEMLLSLKPAARKDLNDSLIVTGRGGFNQLRLVQINIDDRQNPEVAADFTIDGRVVGVRLADNIVRLVMVASPLGFDWVQPAGSGLRAEDQALAANKEIIRQSNLNNWIPAYKDNLQPATATGSLVDCSQMLAPHIFAGLDTLSIIAFNASKKLTGGSWRSIGLATGGQEIYASPDHVYVAMTEPADQALIDDVAEDSISIARPAPETNLKTVIHKFGLEDLQESGTVDGVQPVAGIRPVYMASGQVEGVLLNQFSIDEYQADLRLAVTIENSAAGQTENHIKILRSNQGILKEIGTIPGLGIDERIYAVRFMGPQAYIVTFRQVDPLYALDLSNPKQPKVLGELKITGFSSYLHPVAENLLLGVGQEADPRTGAIEGLQISLFDTSDPTDPRIVSRLLLDDVLQLKLTDDFNSNSFSPVEHDHRAFLFHNQLSFIPYDAGWFGSRQDSFRQNWHTQTGILVIEVKDKTLSVKNNLKAVDDTNQPESDWRKHLRPIRTVVIDDLVYGVADGGRLIVWQLANGRLIDILD